MLEACWENKDRDTLHKYLIVLALWGNSQPACFVIFSPWNAEVSRQLLGGIQALFEIILVVLLLKNRSVHMVTMELGYHPYHIYTTSRKKEAKENQVLKEEKEKPVNNKLKCRLRSIGQYGDTGRGRFFFYHSQLGKKTWKDRKYQTNVSRKYNCNALLSIQSLAKRVR